MAKPPKKYDIRYKQLCFCDDILTWTKPADCLPEEYADRQKMVDDVSYGQKPPDNMKQWHGRSCCA